MESCGDCWESVFTAVVRFFADKGVFDVSEALAT